MENGMTKKQSAVMQGVAIWMMLYHHLYSYATEYESCLPFMHPDIARRIAWFCKICVGIFAFVSGYGMYHEMERQTRERFFGRMLAEYRCALRRIFKLYGKLWLLLVIFMGCFFGVLKRPFTPALFWGNFTALNPTYNAAWWYVEQYAKMLLVLPLLDLALTRFERLEETKKKRLFYAALVAAGLIAVLLGALFQPALWAWLSAVRRGLRISFLLIFVAGYIVARYRVYQRADCLLRNRDRRAPLCLAVALIAAVIALRIMLATDPAYGRLDFVLTPLLVYGLLTLFSYGKPLETVFAWWGGESTYIWLVHGFVYEKTCFFVKSYVGLDFLGYLAALAVSTVAAILLKALERLLGRLLRELSGRMFRSRHL